MYEGLKNLDVPRTRRASRTSEPVGPRHPRRRKFLKLLLIGGLIGVLLVGGVGVLTYLQVKGNIDEGAVPLEGLVAAAPHEPLNILVIGSDSRKGITKADRKKGLGGPGGKRADVIMVLHISGAKRWGDKRWAVGVSIPRDLRVEIPGHGFNKINAAYAFGGLKLMRRTVHEFTGLDINHYIEVNFAGFREIVNEIGGVPVRVREAIHDDKTKLDIPRKGCWILNGDQALGYVRTRYDPTADIGRIQRQQGFLRALAAKVKSAGVLVNPENIIGVSDIIGKYWSYDPALVRGATFPTARTLAALLASDQSKLDFRIVPNYPQYIGGLSYLIPSDGEAGALFSALRQDDRPPDVGTTNQSLPDRNDVSVQVLNATKQAGLASKEARRLDRKNFNVAAPGNAPNRLRSVILFESGDELKAELVQKLYPGVRIREVSDLSVDVAVVLGRDRISENTPPPTEQPQEQCRRLPTG